jgi:hypothetical protein
MLYHVVISNATMMSSFRIRAVKEMETIFKNSFSNNNKDMIMIAAPEGPKVKWCVGPQLTTSFLTLIDANH